MIPLTNSPLLAMVDDEDYEKVSKLKWGLDGAGYARSTTTLPSSGHHISLHHLVFGKPPLGKEIDHRNNTRLDCRKRNLREATHSDNGANKRKEGRNKSGFKGYSFARMGGICLLLERMGCPNISGFLTPLSRRLELTIKLL